MEWAAKVQALLSETGWTHDEVADQLEMSRASVSQAVSTMALDTRVHAAMIEKGRTGWRVRQQDIRRFKHLETHEVLRELWFG